MIDGHIQLTGPFIKKCVLTQLKIGSDIYDPIKKNLLPEHRFSPRITD